MYNKSKLFIKAQQHALKKLMEIHQTVTFDTVKSKMVEAYNNGLTNIEFVTDPNFTKLNNLFESYFRNLGFKVTEVTEKGKLFKILMISWA